MHHRGACRVLAQHTYTTSLPAFSESIELCVRHCSVNYAAGTIVKRCFASVWYYALYSATAGGPRVEMMSIIPLLPVAMSTDRSTDWPCALDVCNTARSFTHESNTYVIRRLAFLNLVFIERMCCTPLPVTLHKLLVLGFRFLVFGLLCRHTARNSITAEMHTTSYCRILVCPQTSKSWDRTESACSPKLKGKDG